MIIYVLILLVTYFLWSLQRTHNKRYTQYGLKGPFALPLVGNFPNIRFRTMFEWDYMNFKKYGHTYYDYLFSINGCLNTSDPELAKHVLIKAFPIFSNRISVPYLPVYARKTLIFLEDDWKRVRAQTSPVFTSQRLKVIYGNFDYPIENCMKNIDQLIDSKQNDNVEVKKLMRSFTLDVIAHVVFSLKTNTYRDDEFSNKVTKLFSVRLPFFCPIVCIANFCQ